MTDLQNAVVLITGAGGGFGREMTKQFAQAGSRLLLTDIDRHMIQANDATLNCYQADLSSKAGCESLYQHVKKDNHSPDILVNNAGITRFGRFDEIPDDEWEKVMQINVLAPMRLSHLFIPDMIARGSGHIVNISSLAGWLGVRGDASYSAAKFALRGFGEALVEEMLPHNIKVTTVYPFFSKTPILNIKKYGSLQLPELPEKLMTNPEDVIAKVLKGIKKNKTQVFPDMYGKVISRLKRFLPSLVLFVNRRNRP